MTRTELDSYLANKEREKGLREGELRSIWKGESSMSLDPNLLGVPTRHGRAQGPFQIMAKFHGPIPEAVYEQASLAADIYARGGMTPEERFASYYGKGKPLPGHPTTDQYVAANMARLGAEQPATQTDAPTISQEQQIMPTIQEIEQAKLELLSNQPQQYAPPQLPPPSALEPQLQGWTLEGAVNNPWTQMGIGILSAPGNYGDPSLAIAQGLHRVQSSAYQRQQAEEALVELQLKQAESKLRQRKLAGEEMSAAGLQELARYYDKAGQPEYAARIRAGITTGLPGQDTAPKYGTGMNVIRKPDGTFHTVQLDTAGNRVEKPLEGTPIQHDVTQQGNIAGAKAAGKEGVELIREQYGTATNAATAVKAASDVVGLLDKGLLTGKLGPLQEEIGAWYSAFTGTQLPQVDATQTARIIMGDIVLPSLTGLKGASSDRDVEMIKQYAGGANITEGALKAAMGRVITKYGEEINRFNTSYTDYLKSNPGIYGIRPVVMPSGGLLPQQQPTTAPKSQGGWSAKQR